MTQLEGSAVELRKASSVVGLPVLTHADAQNVGTVKDLALSGDGTAVIALVTEEGGLLSDRRLVPMEEVESIGEDAVIVSAASDVVDASALPGMDAALDDNESLRGKDVLTTDGQKVGAIGDLYLDTTSGRIEGYEVSGGILSDLSTGPAFLPVSDIERTGPDVVYISPAAAKALEERRARAQEPTTESLVGKTAGQDVRTAEGELIVNDGQTITERHVERARETGRIHELAAAASAGTDRERRQAMDEAVGSARTTASGIWEQFQAKLGEVTDATGRRMDEQQARSKLAEIEDAIGRPVTKVVLDLDDDVVLNFGDIITHQAVQRAYEAGGLDSLLKSVYRAEVTFMPEDLRAPAEPSSTVERAHGGARIVDELKERATKQPDEPAPADQPRAPRESPDDSRTQTIRTSAPRTHG
jgi:uncharacterized protein YrrD